MIHFRAAIELFRSQKIRFLLTVSGIVVGVGSLLLMASLLSVGQEVLRRTSTEATGEDVFTVENDWRVVWDNPDARVLDADDLRNVRETQLLPAERSVTPEYGPDQHQVYIEGEGRDAMVMGMEVAGFDMHHLSAARGRLFTPTEAADRRKVVVLGATALDGKFAPGDTVRIETGHYVVVGILEEKPEMGPGGAWSWNNRLILPLDTYRIAFDPGGAPHRMAVRVVPPVGYDGLVKDYILAARSVVDIVLSKGRTVKSWRFEGVRDDDSTEAVVMKTIQALLYLTTVFSMVVGGINIMNIMLVTVTERTREIGTRRALGASRNDILRQFLAETLMVTLIGAAIGVAGALVLIGIGSAAMTAWVTAWPFRVEPWSIGVGVVFSAVIGLVFGMYPAWRASRLDPVEALRYE